MEALHCQEGWVVLGVGERCLWVLIGHHRVPDGEPYEPEEPVDVEEGPRGAETADDHGTDDEGDDAPDLMACVYTGGMAGKVRLYGQGSASTDK